MACYHLGPGLGIRLYPSHMSSGFPEYPSATYNNQGRATINPAVGPALGSWTSYFTKSEILPGQAAFHMDFHLSKSDFNTGRGDNHKLEYLRMGDW